tara:strand:+ start:334 stop:507 length:174 start_codon:yes stop_codon:yes gene_type:complete
VLIACHARRFVANSYRLKLLKPSEKALALASQVSVSGRCQQPMNEKNKKVVEEEEED